MGRHRHGVLPTASLSGLPLPRLRTQPQRPQHCRRHPMSLVDLGRHLADDSCPWCICGMSPAGIHPDLGPVLKLCPTQRWCTDCDGQSLFPAEYETLDDRVNELFADDLTVIWCSNCNGVAAVIP